MTSRENEFVNLLTKEKFGTLASVSRKQRSFVNFVKQSFEAPPFIRNRDKLSFMFGILYMIFAEYVVLVHPESMSLLYLSSILPLLVIRFMMYHKQKFHYFMLDFCYFSQLILCFHLIFYPNNRALFQLIFALSNGPLLLAIIMWNNSLVFHDIDKMTSIAIHYLPALVTFSLRWFPVNGDYSLACDHHHVEGGEGEGVDNNSNMECGVSIYAAIVGPTLFYIFWQISYVMKTEFIDKQKIEKADLMTSLRWMTEKKPHPIYRVVKKHQYKLVFGPWVVKHPSSLLIFVQLIYTILTMTPAVFMYSSYYFHSFMLVLTFVVAINNGSSFYFSAFIKSYSKRLDQIIEYELKHKNNNNIKVPSHSSPSDPPSSAQ